MTRTDRTVIAVHPWWLVLLVAAQVLSAPLTLHATDWTPDDVKTVVEKVRAGKLVDLRKDYPLEETQAVWFSTPTFQYLIDIRAKLCFIRSAGEAIAQVPCKALKEGYPLMAPIINWEK
jgi:hypothetical protein